DAPGRRCPNPARFGATAACSLARAAQRPDGRGRRVSDLPQPDSSNGNSAPPLAARVVLVGRTGLDAALRLDPEVELLRARNAIDAIGELASPIDDTAPLDTTVIVSAEADPGPPNGSGVFIDALRSVNPDTRVLLVGTGKRGAYDGVILSPLVPQES